MHELSIAQSIISTLEKVVPEGDYGKVSQIHLQIGQLSGIEIDALQFSFDIIKEKSVFSKAVLITDIIEGEAMCNSCNTLFAYASYGCSCPTCGSYDIRIVKGKELRILDVTIQ
jgi:hydrogenase nickel incorporation protein HypA/HybF